MGADCCFIWLRDRPNGPLSLVGVSGNGCPKDRDEFAATIPFTEDPVGKLLDSPGPVGVDCGDHVAVPIIHRGRKEGVLSLGGCRSDISDASLRSKAQEIADLLTSLLRGSQSYRYLQERTDDLTRLMRVSEKFEACRSMDQCLSGITRAAAELTDSAGAILRTVEGGSLSVRSFFLRDLGDRPVIGAPNDLADVQRAMDTNRTVINEDLADRPDPGSAGGPVRRNLLALPFFWEGMGPGVITVFDRIPRSEGSSYPYTRQERESLTALTRIGAWAISQMRDASRVREISRSFSNRIKELSLLHHISRAALNTDDDDIVVRTLLSAITHREGLGFDRALLFLLDADSRHLMGTMGVEVLGWEEKPDGGDPPSPLDGRSDYWVRDVHRDLDARIESMSIQVDERGGVLARTVLEREPFRVKLPRDQELVSEEIIKEMGGVRSFATVPLVSGDRVLGVIWADNIHTSRPIGADDFRLLVSAGAQAGLTVEKAKRTKAIETMKNQLMDLQGRLIQWEKMAALGEMAASVAHEIRNPLISIGGFARRLHRMQSAGSDGFRYTDIIMREVSRLERTLEDVMSYTRGYAVAQVEVVAIEGLVGECVDLFRENFRNKGVTLRQKIEKNLPEVMIDPKQIRQAVINVLVNSGEVVGAGGEVWLDVSTVEDNSGRMIGISITDNGGGLQPEVSDRIFTPFFTTKSTGTGLGLTIAQRAISGHGGEIRVDNNPGIGVTFSMLIPLIHRGAVLKEGEGEDQQGLRRS